MKRNAICVALLCSCAATPSFAQSDAPNPPPTATAGDSGDIVVTAQRRGERLRDVPISITALTAEQLSKSGITNTADIARLTPGFTLQMYGTIPQPSIRGVSAPGIGLGNTSSAAIYLDGVYQAEIRSNIFELPDVQQIEILKGPQGTLYGQNASAGAVIINTIEPQFRLTGKVSASYGNYNDKVARGYITGPINDFVAVSLAAAYEDRDSYRYDVTHRTRPDGLKSRMIRGKVLIRPTDNLSMNLTGFYSKRYDGELFSGLPVGPGIPQGYGYADAQHIAIRKPTNPKHTSQSIIPFQETKQYGFSLRTTWKTGIGDFNAISAYTNTKLNSASDTDYTAANIGIPSTPTHTHSFTQEINFVSKRFGGLVVTAGAFFLTGKQQYVPYQVFKLYSTNPITIYPQPGTVIFNSGYGGWNKRKSYAGFLELNYDITPKLNVTVGGRYASESQLNAKSTLADPLNPITDLRGPIWFNKFTPRATIRYAINSTSNVYASYSQGFKSGYVSIGDTVTTPNQVHVKPVKPEVVTAYEIGYKARLGRLVLNLAAYHYDYKDLQVFVYIPPSGRYENAAKARINGIDFDASVRVTPELTISGGGSYIDGKYKKYPAAGVYLPHVDLNDPTKSFGYDFALVNAKGHVLPRTPKFSGNLAFNYELKTSAGEFTAYMSAYYASTITYDPTGVVKQKPYVTLDGELSFSPSGIEGLRFVLWGKNLTNKNYYSGVLETNYALGATYAAPRTFGGRAEFKF